MARFATAKVETQLDSWEAIQPSRPPENKSAWRPSGLEAWLGGALRFFVNFISRIIDFPDFCRIWHLGGFGRMENTPTGCADDLPTILGIFKNDPSLMMACFLRSRNIYELAYNFHAYKLEHIILRLDLIIINDLLPNID